MNYKEQSEEIFPAEEPLILLLTDFLSRRLNQLLNNQHSHFQVPVVPDGKTAVMCCRKIFPILLRK